MLTSRLFLHVTCSTGNLPQNKHYNGIVSDGVGCDYGNNWNSVHYGKEKMSSVRLELRSSRDSFIAASGYTQSCSNDYTTDHSCFGLTRREDKYEAWVWIHIAFGLFLLEILVYCVIRMVTCYRQKKAIRDSEISTRQGLMNETV